jgi:hypothetical protein
MNTRPSHIALSGLAGSLFLALAACNAETKLDAKSAHDTGHGTVRDYDGTYDQVWAAAHAAISWNEVGAPTDHAAEHYLVTDPAKFDQIGVWLEPQGADKVRVATVVIDDPNLPGPNEEGVQKDIASALSLVKAGQATAKRP